MVHSNVALPANEVAAFDGGAPAFLAENVLASAIIGPIWTTDGDLESESQADPLFPIGALTDRSMAAATRSLDSGTTQAISAEIPASTFDTAIIHFQDVNFGTYDVFLEVADDDSFTVNLLTVASITGVTRVTRVVFDNFTIASNPNRQMQGVQFVRVRFVRTAGVSTSIFVREIALGRRLQLSQPFLLPYDPQALGSTVRFFRSAAQGEHATTYAEGFADRNLTYRFTGTDFLGLDDLATLRSLQVQSRGGALPVFARIAPSEGWLLGDFSNLNTPISDFVVRDWASRFTEHAPFRSRET